MKFFRWNKHYLGWGITAFIVIVASILVFLMLANFESIKDSIGTFFSAISPIIYGLIFAYLLTPVETFFEKRAFKKLFVKYDRTAPDESGKYPQLRVYVKNKPRRILSLTITMVLVIGIVIGCLIAIIPQLTTTITMLVDNMPGYISNANEWIKEAFASYPDIEEELTSVITEAGSALKGFLTKDLLPQMGDYLGFLTNGIMSLVGLMMNIVFGIVVAVYCMYSKELFAAQIKKTIYCFVSVKRANRFIASVRKIHRSFGTFITGTLIDSFVVCCITIIATTIFKVPFYLLVSIIMGITNIIPYFGPFIGLVPCLLLIFMEEPMMCITFVIIVLVIQNLNGNIISPKILGESTGLTSFWVIFAILVGQAVFGFWGLIIGIPLFAVVYSATRTFISDRLSDRGLPSGSEQYTDIMNISETDLSPLSLYTELENERLEKERAEALQKKKKAEEPGPVRKLIDRIRNNRKR